VVPNNNNNTIPSKEQFKKLMSQVSTINTSEDIRLKQPGHGLQVVVQTSRGSQYSDAKPVDQAAPKDPVKPAQAGASCLTPDGQIDWARMPVRPANLPADVDFRVWPEKGKWRVAFKR
jgi:hypothetical protein